MEDENKKICDRLKMERVRLGLSLRSVADSTGASESSFKRWEKSTPIPADKLSALAALGFDVRYIDAAQAFTSEGFTKK